MATYKHYRVSQNILKRAEIMDTMYYTINTADKNKILLVDW